MDKIVVFSNVFLGLLAISVEISALVFSGPFLKPDLVSSGIWGGVYLLMFALLLQTKKLVDKMAVIIFAVYAILVGVTLIGLYAWSIDNSQKSIALCGFLKNPMCDRVAIDSLMIACGILTFIVNVLAIVKSSSLSSNTAAGNHLK